MPEICRFYGIVIRMYYEDHNPPHFHAEYQDYSEEYDIHTLKIINGNMARRAHSMILEWSSLHREELLANWEKAKVPAELSKIKPLD